MTLSKTKKSWSIFSLVFVVIIIFSLACFTMMAVIVDEIAEGEWAIPKFMRTPLTLQETWQDSTGNEFTGEVTALMFGLASLPVAFDLISRSLIRFTHVSEKVKGFIRYANNKQRKHLMPFHTYLSILALGFGFLHLRLSSCYANPFPEWGLILSGILVGTGLLFKWKAVSSRLRKFLYKFHSSLVVSGILLAILLVGHSILNMD